MAVNKPKSFGIGPEVYPKMCDTFHGIFGWCPVTYEQKDVSMDVVVYSVVATKTILHEGEPSLTRDVVDAWFGGLPE